MSQNGESKNERKEKIICIMSLQLFNVLAAVSDYLQVRFEGVHH